MGKYVIKETATGIKFDLKATNGIVIGTSEVFTSKTACKNSIESVKKNAPDAPIEDQTVEEFETQKNPKFVLYTDKRGETRFKLNARNGENILASGEGYKTKAAALNGIDSVKRNADSEVVEQ
ncbi:MAG: YegP family protein [Clostridiales bacterium]|nr:YegP family protein [Clostridiales bacterium]